jgi:hypothetical protein
VKRDGPNANAPVDKAPTVPHATSPNEIFTTTGASASKRRVSSAPARYCENESKRLNHEEHEEHEEKQ